MTQTEKNAALQLQQDIIRERTSQLRTKDYIGTKIAMGVATREEYAAEIAQTERWRTELNAAQEEITRLEAVEVEELMGETIEEGGES